MALISLASASGVPPGVVGSGGSGENLILGLILIFFVFIIVPMSSPLLCFIAAILYVKKVAPKKPGPFPALVAILLVISCACVLSTIFFYQLIGSLSSFCVFPVATIALLAFSIWIERARIRGKEMNVLPMFLFFFALVIAAAFILTGYYGAVKFIDYALF